MLIACPECAHEVSSRAVACPRCGFPIAEHVGQQRQAQAAEQERASRERTGTETDCEPCKGRGFAVFEWTNEEGREVEGFSWCERCKETGHLPVVRSSRGYFAVALDHVEAFVAGHLPVDSEHVTALGSEPPPPPSYPAAEPTADSSTS